VIDPSAERGFRLLDEQGRVIAPHLEAELVAG
jgi:hypothetical protein